MVSIVSVVQLHSLHSVIIFRTLVQLSYSYYQCSKNIYSFQREDVESKPILSSDTDAATADYGAIQRSEYSQSLLTHLHNLTRHINTE